MKINIPSFLSKLNEHFAKNNRKIYLVGGAVRNVLLGLKPNDFDVSGAARVEEVYKILEGTNVEIVPIAPEFGTVQLHVLDGDIRQILEYTTFRKDVYLMDGTHRPSGVTFSDDIECDAFRRDFSVNAIYADLGDGIISDPTGGLNDIEKKLIRTTSKNSDTILKDDGLRTLRLVRFAAELGFEIDQQTRKSAKKYSHFLKDIPVERIWKEFQKILLSDIKYDLPNKGQEFAHFRALDLMLQLGIMEYVLPELLEGKGIMQDPQYHAFDVLHHNIHSCKHASPVLEWRLAALLHDVGKPSVFLKSGAMLGHDVVGEEMTRVMLERLKIKNEIIDDVTYLVRWHMYDLNNVAKESTIRKKFVQMGVDFAHGFIDIRTSDFLGSGKQKPPVASSQRYTAILEKMISQKIPFDPNQLAIDGNDIMSAIGEGSSVKIGIIKQRLLLHCAVKPRDNVRNRLMRMSRIISKQIES